MVCPGPVGVVGVGNMGGAMAKRLIGLGWSVQVCDIDASRTAALHALGAGVHTHAADLARSCAVVIVCVVGPVAMGVKYSAHRRFLRFKRGY